MLPFLKPKQVAGILIKKRTPDGSAETAQPEDQADQGLGSCADELIRAVHAKDSAAVAGALRSAFEILSSEEATEPQISDEQA